MSHVGRVYLVGAGPGDPGLLTLRGLNCLQQADLVLYDGLVNPLLLRHTTGRAERTSRRARLSDGRVPQTEVNERMIAAARAGQTVVRLKGGDPFIFGRGGEEAAALASAGIPYEVVPGITAATAAAVEAGISLTHREHASAVALVAGHEVPGKGSSPLDYEQLAKFPGTLVFYMGLHRAATIADALLAAGRAPDTPAAIVCQTTLASRRIVTSRLDSLAAMVGSGDLHAPSLIVIGDCVRQRLEPSWIERRPLNGLSIGLARSDEQLDPIIERVLQLGGDPLPMPLIRISPPADWSAVDDALRRLHEFGWVVFTSVNGVRSLLGRLWDTGRDARAFAAVKLAAIGPATAAEMSVFRLRADLIPASYRAEDMAAALAPLVSGQRVLWARANRGRDVLAELLVRAGALLEEVVAYQNEDVDALGAEALERLQEGRLQWVALSSPSIARNLARCLRKAGLDPAAPGCRLAAISPVTAEAARDQGLHIDAVAEEYTWEGLLQAIARASAAVAGGVAAGR